MNRTNDIQEFMMFVPWKELDINEKQALFNAIESTEPINYGLFEVRRTDKGRDVLELICPLYDVSLVISVRNRASSLKWIEDTYMHGEDGNAYLSWLAAINNENIKNSAVTETTITMLPLEEQKVLKKISIAAKARTLIHFATIMYTRQLSETYNENSPQCTIYRTPQGDVYFQDILDEEIFKTINHFFKSARLTSENLLFDADQIRQENIIKNRRRVSISITFEHNDEQFVIPLYLYCTNMETKQIFSNLGFSSKVNHQQIFDRLKELAVNSLTLI